MDGGEAEGGHGARRGAGGGGGRTRLVEGSLREASDRNDTLSWQISRLRSEIDDARARQEEACGRRALLKEEAQEARDRKRRRINALTTELGRAEAGPERGGKEPARQSSRIAELDGEIAEARARQRAREDAALTCRSDIFSLHIRQFDARAPLRATEASPTVSPRGYPTWYPTFDIFFRV